MMYIVSDPNGFVDGFSRGAPRLGEDSGDFNFIDGRFLL